MNYVPQLGVVRLEGGQPHNVGSGGRHRETLTPRNKRVFFSVQWTFVKHDHIIIRALSTLTHPA